MSDQELQIKIGKNINKYRKKKGLTLSYLGDVVGCGKSNIIPITKGKVNITVSTLNKIAAALDVEPGDLLK